jgi:NSS family neurotransmitter:Na+ symporter
VFNAMPGGRLWGSLFFLFMCFAAFSTVIAVFENIVSYGLDLTKASRKKVVLLNGIAIAILSMPCVLGFNVLSFIQPLGEDSSVLDLRISWSATTFSRWAAWSMWPSAPGKWAGAGTTSWPRPNAGQGMRVPRAIRFYMKWILPVIVLYVFVMGYKSMFFS